MKNPFIREERYTGLWATGFVTGLLSAGTIAWIFYLEWARRRREAAEFARYRHDHAFDYMKPKPAKQPQSDIDDPESLVHSDREEELNEK